MSEPSNVLVAGTLRSGTTFLSALLGTNPEVASFGQPLPLLFVAAKRRFLLEWLGTTAPYPLNDQQFGNFYPPEALLNWLRGEPIAPHEVREAFAEMAGYSGALQVDAGDFIAGLEPLPFYDLVARYLAFLDAGSRPRRYRALKETVGVEEFSPYWIDRGGKVILVVRNPVEVARSLSLGRHDEYTGARRPLLWLARNWRKSALYALAFRDNANCLVLGFKEAVADPAATNQRIRDFLGLAVNGATTPLDFARNSSGASDETAMPPGYARFIEAWCWFEMRALSLPVTLTRDEAEAQLRETLTFDFLEREALANLAYDDRRRDEELARHRALTAGEPFNPAYTLFPAAHAALTARAG